MMALLSLVPTHARVQPRALGTRCHNNYTQHMHDATHIHGSRTLPHSMLPYTGTRMITCSGSLPSSMMAQPNPWTP